MTKTQSIIDGIRARIASGELAQGQPLPTYQELAEEYGASESTVQRALDWLRAQGVIRGHQGKRTYVVDGGG
mgnify:CR=1 FL=1